MAYADKREVKYAQVTASISDATKINGIVLPPHSEVEVFGMRSLAVVTSPTSNATIRLKNGSTVLAEVAITQSNGTSAKDSTAGRFPFTVTNDTANDLVLDLVTNQASGTGCNVHVEVHYSYPGKP